jgi:hypothetical protein
MPRPAPVSAPVLFDIDAESAVEDFASLPEWIQKRIVASPTWEERVGDKVVSFTEMLNNDTEGELPF